MHHGSELATVAILALALAAGAFLRAATKKIAVPYTVAMTLFGLGLGALLRHGLALHEATEHASGHGAQGVLALLAEGHFVSSDLIIFVFLPALVFESAFSLDPHAFRKQLGFVLLLALPALVIATVATGGAMVALTGLFTGWEWTWAAGLVFGALISATDPVAVVALLREVGAPKRLGLLIEGESLLNDGTAIVLFGVLVAGLQAAGSGAPVTMDGAWLGHTLLELLRVAGGGILVGGIFAWFTATWLGRIFDDALAESTLTIVLAYAAMAIAEGLLHVSGVLALVTAGLALAGPGRTRITPQVMHFLHQFWEMLAYVANTVIFFLVGLIIAAKLGIAGLATLALVPLTWLALVVIRAGIVFGVRPIGNAFADSPVDPRSASVMAWGGLRGAVSLALALLLEGLPGIPEALGAQVLAVTTGVVLLTLLVNGSTTGTLLRRLGLTTPGPVERLATVRDDERLHRTLEEKIDAAKHEPALRTLDWRTVDRWLQERGDGLANELDEAELAYERAERNARRLGSWRRALAAERTHYRRAFTSGTLQARSLSQLEAAIDHQLDDLDRGRVVIPASRIDAHDAIARRISQVARDLGASAGHLALTHLVLRYDQARSVASAARDVRHFTGDLDDDPAIAQEISSAYARYEREARATLEDFRVNLPEVATEIEARLAATIALDIEESTSEELAREGAISAEGLRRARTRLRTRRKELYFERMQLELPETAEICAQTPLFAGLGYELMEKLAVLTEEMVLERGELLFAEGDRGDAMYIVARGAVEVVRGQDGEELLATLGGGDILGEIALLADVPRTASARAATAVTLGRIRREEVQPLMDESPDLETRIWEAYGKHTLDNALRVVGVPGDTRRMQVEGATLCTPDAGTFELGPHGALVLRGEVEHAGAVLGEGRLVPPHATLSVSAGTRLMALGAPARGSIPAAAPTPRRAAEEPTR